MKPTLAITLLSVITQASLVSAQDSSHFDEKYLIVHADDAGMSHSVNMATIQAMENGLVSSVSIMVPCPWFSEFAKYAREHPEGDYGIHLTLNAEWDHYRWGPVAPREKVPSLVDQDGYLWDNVRQVAENAKAEEVATELRAQISRARQFGVPLSHLDTHMGAVFSRPDLLAVYVQLGVEFDLPVLFLRRPNETVRQVPGLAERFDTVLAELVQRGFPVLDRLEQFYSGSSHAERRQKYVDTIRSLQPGVTQIIIHCGYDNAELQAITNSSPRRDGDRRIFTEPEVAKLIKEEGIQVVGWKQLRGILAKQQAAPK